MCYVVIVASAASDGNDQRALRRSHVQHGDVDVRGQLLLSAFAKALLLQSIAQFLRVHDPRHRTAEADGGRNRKLRVVNEVGRHVSAREGLADVRLWTPDDVVSARHHRLVGVVDRDVFAQNQKVVKTFKDVFKGNPFFL